MEKKSAQDEIYLEIWDKQQASVKQRWSVITLFITVSFAIFGFSLQNDKLAQTIIAGNVQRIVAVLIYWFSYLIYRQYSDWSRFLRKQLEKMEEQDAVHLKLQYEWKKYSKGIRKILTVKNLLLYFGLIYTVITIYLWFQGV